MIHPKSFPRPAFSLTPTIIFHKQERVLPFPAWTFCPFPIRQFVIPKQDNLSFPSKTNSLSFPNTTNRNCQTTPFGGVASVVVNENMKEEHQAKICFDASTRQGVKAAFCLVIDWLPSGTINKRNIAIQSPQCGVKVVVPHPALIVGP